MPTKPFRYWCGLAATLVISFMKPGRWCGLAAILLGAFSFVRAVKADNPPWPTRVHLFALDSQAAEEGSDPATFLVVRIGPVDQPLTVQYAIGGTAVNGTDYDLLPGTVTIPTGAYFTTITLTPIDDYDVEGTESAVLSLQQPPTWPPPYIVSWPSVAFAEIADNDPAPTNRPPAVAIVRPPNGAVFDADDEISIVARAFDPDGLVHTVEFFDGTNSLGIVTNHPITVVPLASLHQSADPTFEIDPATLPDPDTNGSATPVPLPGNLFRFLWTDPPPGRHLLTAVATDNRGASTESAPIEITVLERPPIPVVRIKAIDPIASEPDPTTDHLDTATFVVHRRGPTNFPLTVYYRIGGTASNGVDYTEIPNSVEIPAGERNASIVIAPLDDQLVEGPETVVLALLTPACDDSQPPSPDCYTLGHCSVARAIILDNDTPPNQPPLVRLVRPEDGEVFRAPADIRLAALARDFDGYVTTVEFFEGTNSLGMVSNNPAILSPVMPPFSLVWSNVPPGNYVLTAVATDNEGAQTPSRPTEIKVVPQIELPVVNITTIDPVAAENGVLTVINPAVFSVTRTGKTNDSLNVFYRIGGTASNGVDYTLLTGQVQIPSGAVSNSIVINPIDDNLVEGTETVVLKLELPPVLTPAASPLPWYRIGSNRVARAIIEDDELPPTNLPPRVAIVAPHDGDVFCAPVDIKLAAAGYDPDGWVQTIEFFDGTTSLGTVTNQPSNVSGTDASNGLPDHLFRLLWQNVTPGPHILVAVATDNDGAMTKSDPVGIKVLPPQRPPVVTIYATDPYASEGSPISVDPVPLGNNGSPVPGPITLHPQTATFTVVRKGDLSEDLTVFYELGGTASNGVDYAELPGRVTIPKGSDRAQFVVKPIDDNLPEGTETVVATLAPVLCPAIIPPSPACYIVGDPNQAVAYIFDNDLDQSPKLEIVHPSDGDVFRTGSDIEIDVAVRDPDGWVGKVEFFANGDKIGEQQIYYFVPPPPGQPQQFSMVWSNVPAGGYALTAKATDDSGATAVSDPVNIKVANLSHVPVVTINAVDPVASEPNPAVLAPIDTASFRVSRTGDLSQPLDVSYRISGTASNGVDYQALSGVVTIPSNSPSALILVVPVDDQLVEGTESVVLSLLQPPCVTSNAVTPDCYLVGHPGCDIAYIRDNDLPNRPPTVAIVSPPNGAVFAAPLDLRLVAAAGDSDGWVTTVEFFDGTNSLGIAHNPVVVLDATPVRLSDLNTDVITADSLRQPFSLIWSNVPPGKHILTAVATDNAGDSTRSRPIKIAVRSPNDLPVVRIMATDAVAREGTTNTAAFRILRTGPTNNALTVFYTIGGTASNGVDYVAIPNTIMIPAGQHSGRIVITPIDDNLPERVETVLLRLTQPPFDPPTTYEIGHPARAGAVILDNDHPVRAPEPLADGCLHLRLAVTAGLPFRVESSTNLVDWEEESCGYASPDGVNIVVGQSGDSPHRFYRVVPEYGNLDDEQ